MSKLGRGGGRESLGVAHLANQHAGARGEVGVRLRELCARFALEEGTELRRHREYLIVEQRGDELGEELPTLLQELVRLVLDHLLRWQRGHVLLAVRAAQALVQHIEVLEATVHLVRGGAHAHR